MVDENFSAVLHVVSIEIAVISSRVYVLLCLGVNLTVVSENENELALLGDGSVEIRLAEDTLVWELEG